jgi:hypothetical protein
MKRIIFTFVLVVITLGAFAQFDFGIKAGYNSSLGFSNIDAIGDKTYTLDNVKAEMWNNFHAGVYARVFIKKFYIQPELMYSIQKKEYDMLDVLIDGSATDVDTYMQINSVVVPVFLGYKLLDLKIASLRVFAGPKFIMDAGSSLEYRNITSQQVTSAKLAEEFKNSQVDLDAGAGLDIFMFSLEAKMNLIQDIGGKIKSGEDLRNMPVPSSNFVISLSWNLF